MQVKPKNFCLFPLSSQARPTLEIIDLWGLLYMWMGVGGEREERGRGRDGEAETERPFPILQRTEYLHLNSRPGSALDLLHGLEQVTYPSWVCFLLCQRRTWGEKASEIPSSCDILCSRLEITALGKVVRITSKSSKRLREALLPILGKHGLSLQQISVHLSGEKRTLDLEKLVSSVSAQRLVLDTLPGVKILKTESTSSSQSQVWWSCLTGSRAAEQMTNEDCSAKRTWCSLTSCSCQAKSQVCLRNNPIPRLHRVTCHRLSPLPLPRGTQQTPRPPMPSDPQPAFPPLPQAGPGLLLSTFATAWGQAQGCAPG
uniref:RBD domain-containing protein n=1 Tax=Monodelphis domestica TaxID=13616 RepID=A0A5F8GAG5_MONDO